MVSSAASGRGKSNLVSAIVSSIVSCIIFGTLRFYADWFISSQLNTLVGGFFASWLFLFSLTAVSNVEMLIFGSDFQAKFVPEIVFCLILAVIAASVVHRVCATTCILFSIVGLYFVNRISNRYHNRGAAVAQQTAEQQQLASAKKTGGKRNKQN